MPPLPPLRSAPSRCRCRCRCPRRPRLLPDRAGRAWGTARGRDRPRSASAGSARHRRRPLPATAALGSWCPAGSGGPRPEALSCGGTPSTVAFARTAPLGSQWVQVGVKAAVGDHGPAPPGHRAPFPTGTRGWRGAGTAFLWVPPGWMWDDPAGSHPQAHGHAQLGDRLVGAESRSLSCREGHGGSCQCPRRAGHLGTVGTSPRKTVRGLILTVMPLSVPGQSAPSERGGLHSSLPKPLGSRGSVLSREAHG